MVAAGPAHRLGLVSPLVPLAVVFCCVAHQDAILQALIQPEVGLAPRPHVLLALSYTTPRSVRELDTVVVIRTARAGPGCARSQLTRSL